MLGLGAGPTVLFHLALQHRRGHRKVGIIIHAVHRNWLFTVGIHPPVVHAAEERTSQHVSKSSWNDACDERGDKLVIVQKK